MQNSATFGEAASAAASGEAAGLQAAHAAPAAAPVAGAFTPLESPQYTIGVSALDGGANCSIQVHVATSDQFAARLRKMYKQRRKWAKKAGVYCYRIYDADLPDYAAAIDLYECTDPLPNVQSSSAQVGQRFLHIAEYKAPPSIDPTQAAQRFADIVAIAPVVCGIDPQNVFCKTRRHDKGGRQYGKQGAAGAFTFCTREAGMRLEVDLCSYLDTGLFLDHRTTRQLVRQLCVQVASAGEGEAAGGASDSHLASTRPAGAGNTAVPIVSSLDTSTTTTVVTTPAGANDSCPHGARPAGARFLNLFAYTGSCTVQAAAAGASRTVTVDLSQTYLDWARRNMEMNGFTGKKHSFERADTFSWLRNALKQQRIFDVIFVDPPTFSNSKAMRGTWDVQRDHAKLLALTAGVLAPGGTIVFSCNLRSFKLDEPALARAGLAVQNITAQTIPPDFERNPKIHHCYLLRKI